MYKLSFNCYHFIRRAFPPGVMIEAGHPRLLLELAKGWVKYRTYITYIKRHIVTPQFPYIIFCILFQTATSDSVWSIIDHLAIWRLWREIEHQHPRLTLKRLDHFCKERHCLFSNVVHDKCNISIWKWSNTMNIYQHCGYWWPGALAPGHQ